MLNPRPSPPSFDHTSGCRILSSTEDNNVAYNNDEAVAKYKTQAAGGTVVSGTLNRVIASG
jgi:hypothetical protein